MLDNIIHHQFFFAHAASQVWPVFSALWFLIAWSSWIGGVIVTSCQSHTDPLTAVSHNVSFCILVHVYFFHQFIFNNSSVKMSIIDPLQTRRQILHVSAIVLHYRTCPWNLELITLDKCNMTTSVCNKYMENKSFMCEHQSWKCVC